MIKKNSFTLIILIYLVTIFSFFSLNILNTKTLQSQIQTKSYYETQAKLHIKFAKNLIKSMNLNDKDEKCITQIVIPNKEYEIQADIFYISQKTKCKNSDFLNFDLNNTNGMAIVNLYVILKSSIFKVSFYEKFLKKL